MSVAIDGTVIGEGRTYIIAEVGSNHNGELPTAKALIDAAARAGADAVKFQAFRAKDHYSKHTPKFQYLEEGGFKKSTYDLIASLEINRDWHPDLMDHAAKRHIAFLSSPCDAEAVNQLARLGMAAFKVASFDLPDTALIREIARHHKPVLLSTGMADWSDIERALAAMRAEKNDQAILLQCTSLYPAPARLANLKAMATMRQAFGVPVGYSDHTLGDAICLAAVTLGACVIEKHFTLDRTLPGPDHPFAAEPAEFAAMVQRIREIESAIGHGRKEGPSPEEREMFEKGRRSLHTRTALKAGEVLTADNVRAKRPGFGIPPHLLDCILGRTVARDIPEDHWISWDDFKPR